MKASFFILVLCCLFVFSVFANVKPNTLFSNNMVLQQGVKVPVWGRADVNEHVTVEFCGQKVSTRTDKNGKWFLQMNPLQAGGPFEMIITGQNSVKVSNILVGEVWICGGQSNMERQMHVWSGQKPILNWMNEVKDAQNYPQIRQFYVSPNPSITRVEDVNSKWVICDSINAKSFSAVGFFFGRSLFQNLKVPIGLIFSSVGGTRAEKWTSRVALEENEDLKSIVADYEKSIIDFPAVLAKFKFNEDSLLTKWKSDINNARITGKPLPRQPKAPIDPVISGECGGLFNGMIAPLIPFAIKGVIWYQGESNSGRAKQYQTLFPSMISNWRKLWNIGDFPFLFVQIAPQQEMNPEIREAQLLTWKRTPNTAMVVTVDCGDSVDIHPANKKPVGERLALAAEAIAYKQKVVYSGPIYSSMEVKGKTIELSFDFVNRGLISKGENLKDFVIAGNDKIFVPAIAIIKKNKVVVSAENVINPVAVRMGWSNVPHVNLFYKNGLPASPFRTDFY